MIIEGYIRLYRGNGKENGNYCLGLEELRWGFGVLGFEFWNGRLSN